MKNTIPHRDRKNPRAAELWRERKRAANRSRGSQLAIWDDVVKRVIYGGR